MKLSETSFDNSETGCCARLDVEKWDGQSVTWKDKPFLKDHIRAFLHVPLSFGSVISRDLARVEDAGAYPADPIWLTDEVSPWGADIYTAVDRDELPGATVEHLSGTFMTKVFEGPYRDTGKWIQALGTIVSEAGHTLRHTYVYYATCPSCAKHFGANRTVLFGRVA